MVMKRVQAACICQTLHFFQKDEVSKERNEKLSREEIEHELEERAKNEQKEEKIRQEQIEKANRNRRGYIR